MHERYKILSGMLALHEFTVSTLSQFAQVKANTVRTVLQREQRRVERVSLQNTGKRGGRFVVMRVKSDCVESIRVEIQALLDVFSKSPRNRLRVPIKLSIPLGFRVAEEAMLRLYPLAESESEKAHLLRLASLSHDGASYEADALSMVSDKIGFREELNLHSRLVRCLIGLAADELAPDTGQARFKMSSQIQSYRAELLELVSKFSDSDQPTLAEALIRRLEQSNRLGSSVLQVVDDSGFSTPTLYQSRTSEVNAAGADLCRLQSEAIQLIAWLKNESWNVNELTDWLQGSPWLASSPDSEPYVSLLRALSETQDREWARKELARRTAVILSQEPDLRPIGDRYPQLMYNVLMLSAHLSCPAELGLPLQSIFDRRSLKLSWLGRDIRDCLRFALIRNQLGRNLEHEWHLMVGGQGHDFLNGNEYHGLDAIRLMTPNSESPFPVLSAIGQALKAMTVHLSENRDRRIEFQLLIERIVATYPEYLTWPRDLVLQAHSNGWPSWALSCLPSMFVSVPQSAHQHVETYLLSELYLPLLKKWGHPYHIQTLLCEGYIAEVILSPTAEMLLNRVVPELERRRLRIPYPNYRAVVGAVTDAMSELEISLETDRPDKAFAIKEAREDLLTTKNLMIARAAAE